MSQSYSYRLEEFPICIAPGLSIGLITDGIADLSIDWDAEQDRAYVERVEIITLAVEDLTRKSAPPGRVKLDPESLLFELIEEEIHRLDVDGDLGLKYDREPDPDALRDARIDDGIYIGLRTGAAA